MDIELKEVEIEKKYWFVRTYGGDVFDEYIENGYVGIGLNKVPNNYILEADRNFVRLQEYIHNNTEYQDGSATKWAKQLVSFHHEVNIGDTVIIPDVNSDNLAFGIIDSEVYIEVDKRVFSNRGETQEYPQKRRRVIWDRVVHKDNIQSDLKAISSSHQGITNIDKYFDVIESYLSSVFKRGNKTYMVININQDEDINAFELSRFLSSLTYLYQELCEYYGFEKDEELFIKIKLQSKGKALLSALAGGALLGLSAIFALSDNPSVKVNFDKSSGKIDFDAKSDGGLNSITRFLDAKEKRRQNVIIFNDSMKKLKANNIQASKPVGEFLKEKQKDKKTDTN